MKADIIGKTKNKAVDPMVKNIGLSNLSCKVKNTPPITTSGMI
jgi:hypothetical protein